MVIYLESQLPGISSDLPENGAGHSFYSPIRSCTRWGLPSRQVTLPLVRSYRTVSSLPQKCGGLFSVALSLRSPSLAVSQHPALWSPDFPHSTLPISWTGTPRLSGPLCMGDCITFIRLEAPKSNNLQVNETSRVRGFLTTR